METDTKHQETSETNGEKPLREAACSESFDYADYMEWRDGVGARLLEVDESWDYLKLKFQMESRIYQGYMAGYRQATRDIAGPVCSNPNAKGTD
ncbi:MAG: hypothetical protein AAF571_03450 [Verrucomicrobiota bacterium]